MTTPPKFKWPDELREELKIDNHAWEDESFTYYPRLVFIHPVNGHKQWRYSVDTDVNPTNLSFRGTETKKPEEWEFPIDTPPADIMRFIYCHYVLGG